MKKLSYAFYFLIGFMTLVEGASTTTEEHYYTLKPFSVEKVNRHLEAQLKERTASPKADIAFKATRNLDGHVIDFIGKVPGHLKKPFVTALKSISLMTASDTSVYILQYEYDLVDPYFMGVKPLTLSSVLPRKIFKKVTRQIGDCEYETFETGKFDIDCLKPQTPPQTFWIEERKVDGTRYQKTHRPKKPKPPAKLTPENSLTWLEFAGSKRPVL